MAKKVPESNCVFDLVKLGFKRMMAPSVACEPVFFGAPLVGAASILAAESNEACPTGP